MTSLIDPNTHLVADTSAVINLNATGCATDILRALRNSIVVTTLVPGELALGRTRGRRDADLLQELINSGLIGVVELNDTAAVEFERLVVGPAAMTLDDGEASTIAYAHAANCTVVIDEKKARRLCGNLYPSLPILSSADLLISSDVGDALGRERQASAVLNALKDARMRVPSERVNDVVALIGEERASSCSSLARYLRRRPR